jgi:malate synthase
MNENLKDILSNLSTDVDQETLLLYLQGKLSAEKQHELEMQLLDNDFAADAVEGLQQVDDKQNIDFIVEQLNRDLKKKTARKKATRKKRQLDVDPWLIIFLIFILLLVAISYYIIHRQLHP